MDGYTYIIEMVDQISGPAKSAKAQIDSLTTGLSADAKEVETLKSLYAELKAQGALTASEEAKLQAGIDKGTKSMDQQTAKIRSLVKGEQDKVKSDQEEAQAQAKANDEATGFNSTLEASMAYLVAFAAIVAAVAIALGGLYLAGAKMAIDATQFKTQTTAALRQVVGTSQAADATYRQIEGISDNIGISNARAQDLGLSLLQAGVKQNQLGDAISGIAALEKVRGADAANKLQKAIETSSVTGKFKFSAKQFVGTGINESELVTQLSKNMKQAPAVIKAELEKGKISASDGTKAINDVLKTQLGDASGFTSFGDAVDKIKEKFSRLFESDEIKGGVTKLLGAFKEISSWFDDTSVQGQALKWLFGQIFGSTFSAAQTLLPYLKIGFLELVIVALKIYIAMKPVLAAFESLGKQLGITGTSGDFLSTVIVDIIDVFGEWISVTIGGVTYIVDLITLLVAVFQALYGAGKSFIGLVENEFSAALTGLENLFSGDTGGDLATDLINGFINGILGGIPKAIGAMTSLGSAAIAAIRDTLGTHSPSTEMANVANDTLDGFDNTVDARSANSQTKLGNAVQPPAGGGAGSGGGGATITVAPGAVVVSIGGGGGGDASAIQAAVESALAEALESLVLQLGGAAAPGVAS